ncbi:hypothetical protein ACF0H5_013572 [Mactra antiquata]
MADVQRCILVVAIVLCEILYCVLSEDSVRNCNIADKTGLPDDVCTYELRMKGAHPTENDQYFCSGYDVSSDILGEDNNPFAEGYIVKYEALADANTAHHILVFGCESLRSEGNNIWKCGQVCGHGEQIVFAWAKNAPPLTLPNGVGQHIGGRTTKINHIVIQIHYVNPLPAPDFSGIRLYTTRRRQPYISGIYLLLSYGVTIPANTPKFHVDSSCVFNWADSIVPFGYRTHAHTLGSVISGYKVNRGGESTLIGKGNPQWPQAFYPVKERFEIRPGDLLAARCTYNSTGRFRETEIGSTSNDEMCNFYIMYYMNSTMELRKGEDTCYRNKAPQVFQFIPADSDEPLPSNPDLEQMAHGHHHGMGVHSHNNEATTTGQLIDEPKVDVEKPLVDIGDNNNGLNLKSELGLKYISSVKNIEIGQVGGLAVSGHGDLHIFHRGSNIWDAWSFTNDNVYRNQDKPIEVDTVIVLNKNGDILKHFGKNRFFLPHGLTVDSKDNIWLTDVGLHQVFRIPKGSVTPDMTLGTRFEPGDDKFHFCKPSDIAVMSTGEFYVSDGYCNSRIVKFDKNGYYIKQWGTSSVQQPGHLFPQPGTFNLPHSLALAEDKQMICVADRENGRIQCFDLEGNFIRQIHPKLFGAALYAVEYCPNHGGILFAVNGPIYGKDSVDTQGFTVDINNGDIVSMWNIPGSTLSHPHDVTVDSTNHIVYVGELNPRKVWKFQMSQALYSTANSSVVSTTQVTEVTKGVSLETKTEVESEGIGPSVIIGTMLVVPVVLLIIITVTVRLYKSGYFRNCGRMSSKRSVFSLGNFLHSHRGFDRLSTEDDDHDFENVLDDSDNEEFNITRKA